MQAAGRGNLAGRLLSVQKNFENALDKLCSTVYTEYVQIYTKLHRRRWCQLDHHYREYFAAADL